MIYRDIVENLDFRAKLERDLEAAARAAGCDMTVFRAKVVRSTQPGVDYQSSSVINYCAEMNRRSA